MYGRLGLGRGHGIHSADGVHERLLDIACTRAVGASSDLSLDALELHAEVAQMLEKALDDEDGAAALLLLLENQLLGSYDVVADASRQSDNLRLGPRRDVLDRSWHDDQPTHAVRDGLGVYAIPARRVLGSVDVDAVGDVDAVDVDGELALDDVDLQLAAVVQLGDVRVVDVCPDSAIHGVCFPFS